MDKKKLEDIVKQIKALEDECQTGQDIEANMQKMNELLEKLSLDELFEVAIQLEAILPNIDV